VGEYGLWLVDGGYAETAEPQDIRHHIGIGRLVIDN
jgi:hypothetical protein